MSTNLSYDEIQRYCHDLVYQVAYAFYDSPYILILKLLVTLGVAPERSLAETLGIPPNDLKKYIGTLHVHRLVKRHVNKERLPQESFRRHMPRPGVGGQDGQQQLRTRDVYYWYIDYREFANVTKYRIAMMRKALDDKIKQEVGHRGYICPNCGKTYNPLDLSHLFDPSTNAFVCDQCGTELIEHDPTIDPSVGSGNQDQMQRFNVATAPIRDCLKAIEGNSVPSLNIVAWIAQNVKVIPLPGEETGTADGENRKFEIVVGGEGDERENLEKARLAEAQRTQNALPVWHTHSTVTGSATALGLNGQPTSTDTSPVKATTSSANHTSKELDEAALEAHYANMVAENGARDEGADDDEDEEADLEPTTVETQPGPSVVAVKREPDLVEGVDEEDEDGLEDIASGTPATPADAGAAPGADARMGAAASETAAEEGPKISVGGVMKPLSQVTDEDQDLMTPEEYQAWYEAMEAA